MYHNRFPKIENISIRILADWFFPCTILFSPINPWILNNQYISSLNIQAHFRHNTNIFDECRDRIYVGCFQILSFRPWSESMTKLICWSFWEQLKYISNKCKHPKSIDLWLVEHEINFGFCMEFGWMWLKIDHELKSIISDQIRKNLWAFTYFFESI